MKSEHPAEIPGHDRKGIAGIDDVSIEDLDLSVRAYNVIRNANIQMVSEFAAFSRRDLLAFKNCGKRTVNEIVEQLSLHSVRLRE